MMRWRAVAVFLVAVAAIPGATIGAAAQTLSFERTDAGRARAELHAAVFGEFQTVMAEWVEAVNDRDAERLSKLYDDGAFLFLRERQAEPGEIEAYLEGWLAGLGSITFGLSAFEASSSLSYASGRVTIAPAGTGPGAQGVMLLVLRRHDRDDWRIRSQTLLLEQPRESAAAVRS
jgi:ketosteroid isomerase-like protein